MSVQHDGSGRRWIEVEVEVPGTPEEVWEAIASGPGVTSWFVPTRREDDEDGVAQRFVSRFGPGPEMEAVSTVTEWDPPRRLAAESAALGPQVPEVATEWIVEARSGGTCVVRVVHSLFADGADWDDQLEGLESGWPGFFRILDLYLTHFSGEHGVPIQLMSLVAAPPAEVWPEVTAALGLAGAEIGDRRSAGDDAPPFAGGVEAIGGGGHPEQILLRLERPTPGLAHLLAIPMQGPTYLGLRLFLYGDQAAAAAARDEPRWREWMAERYPPAAPGGCS